MLVYCDTSNIREMSRLSDKVNGFTCNPSLMRAAGIDDYEVFAKECVTRFPDHSLSFEVIADDFDTMRQQGILIASWGDNVFVKVPVTNCDGISTSDLVRSLTSDGVQVNVTAIFTCNQVYEFNDALRDGTNAYLSIFAGRIADTGDDPTVLIREAAGIAHSNVKILWASTRESYNEHQAEDSDCDIITMSPELIAKRSLYGKNLKTFSLETVKQFRRDALEAKLTL